MEKNSITLSDSAGKGYTFELLDLIILEERCFVVLIEPDPKADEVTILEVIEENDDDELYISVDDEKLIYSVYDAFKRQHSDEYNFVDDEQTAEENINSTGCSLKRTLVHATVLIPFILCQYMILHPISICIPELNFYLYENVALIYFIFAVIWLVLSHGIFTETPLGEICCNLLPAELFLNVIFSQYHFIPAVILGILSILLILYDGLHHRKSVHNAKPAISFALLIASAVLLIPSMISISFYKLESPNHEATQALWDTILDDDTAYEQPRFISVQYVNEALENYLSEV